MFSLLNLLLPLQILLAKGANVEAADKHGCTALMIASTEGHRSVAEVRHHENTVLTFSLVLCSSLIGSKELLFFCKF